jgi:hypothetical protein
MRIEERTKRFWAVILVFMLLMVANFVLYVAPHPCGGENVDCSHITWPNGTITDVQPGHYATVTRDLRGMMFFDFIVGFPAFGLLAWSLIIRLTKQQSLRENEEVTLE